MHGEHCTCYDESEEMQYLTDGKMKYIWFPRTDREQLFDLQKDPHELHSLVDNPEYAKCLEKLRQRMVKELEPRNCGLTNDGKLIRQTKPIISPHYPGKTQKQRLESAL
jgi:arylsulfatase A-like enzyme